MNLTEFAVSRKMTENSDLLSYVKLNKPVPIAILKQDFDALMAPLQDENATAVVNDYPKYLRDNVKTGFIPLGNGQYEVSGDIDDKTMEAIEILHDADRSEVVTDLISNIMNDLRDDRDSVVTDLTLDESETTVPVKASEVQEPDADLTPVQKPVEKVSKEVVAKEPEAEYTENTKSNEVPQKSETTAKTAEALPEDLADLTDGIDDVEPNVAESIPEETKNVSDEVIPDEPANPEVGDLGFMDENVPDSTFVKPTFEAPESEKAEHEAESRRAFEEEKARDRAKTFKDAYDFVTGKFRDAHLDERIPGLQM